MPRYRGVVFVLMLVAAQTAFAGGSGEIAFSRTLGPGDIFLMNADGGVPTNLTDDPTYDGGPVSICPGGRYITFSRAWGGYMQVYGIDLRSGAISPIWQQVFDNYNGDCGLPDSEGQPVVLFIDHSFDYELPFWDIYRIDLDGTNFFRLTDTFGSTANYSPRWCGERIVFISDRDGNPEVYIMDEWGANQTRLTFTSEPELTPSCSPDGKVITFARRATDWQDGYDIFATKHCPNPPCIEGNLTPNTIGVRDVSPSWSPDGTQIAFESDREGTSAIYRMESDGSAVERLTALGAYAVGPDWGSSGRIKIGN